MGDEVELPYKVVGHIVSSRDNARYSIVMERKGYRPYLTEIIPDAGSGETARLVCNLLNEEHKRIQRDIAIAQKLEEAKNE